MSISFKLTKNESHDLKRQSILFRRAEKIASDLIKNERILAVLLSGSVARGPVNEASDLDLHVIITNADSSFNLPSWTFNNKIIENIHIIKDKEILEGQRYVNSYKDLAKWFCRSGLIDQLYKHKPLFWKSGCPLKEIIEQLLEQRSNAAIIKELANAYLEKTKAYVSLANVALLNSAILDCHQNLRWASQHLLIAVLIRLGWVIRGAKKRIEIAQNVIGEENVRNVLDLVINIGNLNEINTESAKRISQLRLELRKKVIKELYNIKKNHFSYKINFDLNCLETLITQEEIYNSGSYDYYKPLIETGFHLGAINHIRSLSGFPHIPLTLLSCSKDEITFPINECFSSKVMISELGQIWRQIAALSDCSSQCMNWINLLNEQIIKIQFE